MRRRALRGVAWNVAHVFAGSCEHYVAMSFQHHVRYVVLDLLWGTIQPAFFDIRRNRILAEMCRNTLARNVAPFTNFDLLGARLILETRLEEVGNGRRSTALVTVTLTDDRGREWGSDRSLQAWWMHVGSGHYFI